MTNLFDCETDITWEFDYMRLYESATGAVLDAEGCPYEACVSLLVTDDENIRQINKDMRNIDASTDVLSFPMIEYDGPGDFSHVEDDPENFDPITGELILGDIVLSKDHIIAQAQEYGHSLEREYTFLIVHSMLHLCGYDHIDESDRILMEERQKIIMQGLCSDFPELAVDR